LRKSGPRFRWFPSQEPPLPAGVLGKAYASVFLRCFSAAQSRFAGENPVQEFAGHSISQSEWAKAYYDHQRNDKNKEHHAAVRSLAFKWIRIIFRCWKDSKPYDEEIYIQSVRRRSSLLAPALESATGAGWKPVAGFQKLSENNT
jgi:hypothetical protein